MLTNTIKKLKENLKDIEKGLKHVTVPADHMFYQGQVDILKGVVENVFEKFVHNNLNAATKEGFGEDYYQGLIAGLQNVIETISDKVLVGEHMVKDIVYVVKVDITEASHIISEYTETIHVKARAGMNMTQLKEWLQYHSPHVIEEYVDARVDSKGSPTVEIYDFDLELIGYL